MCYTFFHLREVGHLVQTCGFLKAPNGNPRTSSDADFHIPVFV